MNWKYLCRFLVLNLQIVMDLSSGEQYAIVLAYGLNLTMWNEMQESVGVFVFLVIHVILFLYTCEN